MYNIEQYREFIKQRLSEYRYNHSVCVADAAKKLAKRYGADVNKAELAGLLHDVTKETDTVTQLEYIEKAGMSITPLERNGTKFHHQMSGAAFVKTELGIDDEEILSSIRYHTTGKADMTLMQEIIYLADFISEDRSYKDIDKVRAEAQRGKEYGMLYATAYTIMSVAKKGSPLHPDTVNAYNWLLDTYFNDNDKKDSE